MAEQNTIYTPADLAAFQKKLRKHTGLFLSFTNSTDTEANEIITEFTEEIKAQYDAFQYITIDVSDERFAEMVSSFKVQTAPTFVAVLEKETVGFVQGFEAPEVITLLESLSKRVDLYNKIKNIIAGSKVVLFMKGNKDAPRCGFSRKMIELLTKNNITEFTTFDILEDQDVRNGIKIYSNWPTFPQLYINTELIGGLDVVTEMAESGELADCL